ncbi:MAG: hypothetical protein JRG73_01345 [Deltaproteobacteria bacterium]|nr:hypothetical protein [Deltaproteobacteria bacterium]MBW2305550.1 hypothetical protein [Deltaproteobacteria bacterium]
MTERLDKSRLGANAIYSASVAVARAAANSLGVSLHCYPGGAGVNIMPIPTFNMINGGQYTEENVELQEFLLVPATAST